MTLRALVAGNYYNTCTPEHRIACSAPTHVHVHMQNGVRLRLNYAHAAGHSVAAGPIRPKYVCAFPNRGGIGHNYVGAGIVARNEQKITATIGIIQFNTRNKQVLDCYGNTITITHNCQMDGRMLNITRLGSSTRHSLSLKRIRCDLLINHLLVRERERDRERATRQPPAKHI